MNRNDSMASRAVRMADMTCKLTSVGPDGRPTILAWADAFLRRERRRELCQLGYEDLGGEA